MRCYVCNKEIVEQPSSSDQCKAHGEHIIHNGLRGKLISRRILCEDCGGEYSKEDAKFCSIFAPFIASLGKRLITPDHGKNNLQTVLGSLYDTPIITDASSGREVSIKDNKVTPIDPFYEINGDHITIYAEKRRINNYINVLSKELKASGKDINDYTIERVTDLHDKGYLAYYFSKGNASFNIDFKRGMVKIATEYAIECGIAREQLKDVLTINEDGTSSIGFDNAKLFPFIPATPFDILYESFRYRLEEGYPSHTLKLFTLPSLDGTTSLFCYIDLFSTFQYYVLLNDDYQGEEINQVYAQRLIPRTQEIPDVTHYRPKELSIVIQEYGIDMNKCPNKAYQEQVKYVQNCINTYPTHTYRIQSSLNNACEKIQQISMFLLTKKKLNEQASFQICKLLNLEDQEKIMSSMDATLTALTKDLSPIEVAMLFDSFSESVELENYRQWGFDVIDGERIRLSIPEESIGFFGKSKEAAHEYTTSKFTHLSCLCFNPSAL